MPIGRYALVLGQENVARTCRTFIFFLLHWQWQSLEDCVHVPPSNFLWIKSQRTGMEAASEAMQPNTFILSIGEIAHCFPFSIKAFFNIPLALSFPDGFW